MQKACNLLTFSGNKLTLNLAVRGKNFKLVLDGDELEKHRGHRATKVYICRRRAW